MAVKVIHHQGAGYSSNLAVAREKMIGLASLHPNVVGQPLPTFLPGVYICMLWMGIVCFRQIVQP